ncbi:MAG: VWA domain-containing protein [bacterium]
MGSELFDALSRHSLELRYPWLLLLALQPLLMGWLRWKFHQQQQQHYCDPALRPWAFADHLTGIHPNEASLRSRLFRIATTYWRDSLNLVAWLLFAFSLSGPQVALPLNGEGENPPASLHNSRLVFLVDHSRSMGAEDVAPSRLRRATLEISEALAILENREERIKVGLSIFSTHAHVFSPPTGDYRALLHYLNQLETLPLPTQGSRLGAAIAETRTNLEATTPSTVKTSRAAIVVLTDGDIEMNNPITEATAASTSSPIPVYILGIGSEEGAGIPTASGDWLHHQGQALVSRMNSHALLGIAQASGGLFTPVSASQKDWQTLLSTPGKGILAIVGEPPSPTKENSYWKNLSAAPLAIATFIWLFLIVPLPHRTGKSDLSPTILGLLITLHSLLLSTPVAAATTADQAYAAYEQQDFSHAQTLYAQLPGYAARLGEGAAWYRMEQWPQAIRAWNKALLQAYTPRQRAEALYNLGNAWFQQGNFRAAATAFRDVQRYQPGHAASLHNRRLSLAWLNAVQQKVASEAAAQRKASPSKREGLWRGSQLAKEGTKIRDTGILPTNEGTESRSPSGPLPALPALSEEAVSAFLEKAQPAAARQQESQKIQGDNTDQIALTRARLKMENLEDQQPRLWKRLFEMEEGFAAPLQQSKPVAGVLPW